MMNIKDEKRKDLIKIIILIVALIPLCLTVSQGCLETLSKIELPACQCKEETKCN